MELKFKDYVYITFISVTPFLLLLLSLKFYFSDKFVLNEVIYWILIIILFFISIITLITTLFYTINHILNEQNTIFKKIIHFILLIVFNVVYIPFYYGFYLVNEKLLGIIMPIVNIGVIVLFSFASNQYILDYFRQLDSKNFFLPTDTTYLSKNNLFTIDVTFDYVCNDEMGDYVVACDNHNDDSFLGVYSYEYSKYSLGQLDDMYYFHLNQTKEYIENALYDYEEFIDDDMVILTYNEDICVLFKSIDYDVDNDNNYDYRLIVIKEVSYYPDMINDFNSLVNSIQFVD